jgi:hypothetical protein
MTLKLTTTESYLKFVLFDILYLVSSKSNCQSECVSVLLFVSQPVCFSISLARWKFQLMEFSF